MQYINPYELLNLSPSNSHDIAATSIRRAKTALFLQIELSVSDNKAIGYITFRNIHLTKADCIKVIDELDDDNKMEYHYFIYQNKHLNDFLTEGKTLFFDNYRIESIYSSPEFIDFVSPYFSHQYNKQLSANFEKWNVVTATKLLLINPIVNTAYLEKCYSGVHIFLRGITNDIVSTYEKVKKKTILINSDLFDETCLLITNTINTKLLNLLPSSQFQNNRNAIAKAISQFAITIHNIEIEKLDSDKTKNHSFCFLMTEIAKSIDCTGLEEKSIRESYFIQKKNLENFRSRLELEKKSPVLHKYLQLSNSIFEKTREIENKSITPREIVNWINTVIPFSELNSLDNDFDKIRTTIALGLRGMAVEVWNKFSSSYVSVIILEKALSLKTDAKTREGLMADNAKMQEFKLIEQQEYKRKQQSEALVKISQSKPTPVPSYTASVQSESKQFNTGCFILIGFIVIVALIAIANSNNSSSREKNQSYPTLPADSSTAVTSSPNSSTAPSYDSVKTSVVPRLPDPNYSVDPIYPPVKMKNGNISGCTSFSAKFDEEINNRLVISAVTSDAAVKIINYETDQCIRFVFINSGTTYTVRHIPQGKYYLKIAYGDGWGAMIHGPKCNGHFLLNASFKKGEEILDFNLTQTYDGYNVPSYSLQLSTYSSDASSSTFSTNSISQNDFENN